MKSRHVDAMKQIFAGDESGCSSLLGSTPLLPLTSGGSCSTAVCLKGGASGANARSRRDQPESHDQTLTRLFKGVKDPVTAASRFRKLTLKQWTNLTDKTLPQALADCRHALSEIANDYTSEELCFFGTNKS